MRPATMLSPDLDLAAAKKRLEEMGHHAWPVGEPGRLEGVVTIRRIESVKDQAAARLRDLMDPDASFPYVHPDHPLSLALERMGTAGADAIPVVSRANIRKSEGIVTLADILAAYGVKQDGVARS